MSDLNTFARHLETANAFADILHKHNLQGTVALSFGPRGALHLFITAPEPCGQPFTKEFSDLANEHDFEFHPCGFGEYHITNKILFTPSLDELGSPVPEAPLTDRS
jgi:hypothetical protein